MSAGERAVELAVAVEAAGGALPLPVGPEPQALSEADELAAFRALELGDLDGRRSACCGKPNHLTWLRKVDDTRACPWCVMELQNDSLVARTHQLANYQRIEREREANQRADGSRAAVANRRIAELNRERDQLKARVAELEAERHTTNEVLDDAVQALRANTGQALPWAHAMDDGDLHDFLGDLVSAALNRWRSDPEVPDRETLADIEKVCADWRTPGQGLRSDEPEMFVPRTERSYWVAIADALNAAHSAGMPVGIDLDGTLTDRNAWSVVWDRSAERWAVAGYEDGFPPLDEASKASFAERAARETDSGRRAAWRMLAEPQPEFQAYLHHENRVSHDLPETGGAQ